MNKFAMLLVVLVFCLGDKVEAEAQVPYVTYYQPVTVYSPPVVYTPRTVYYAPAPAPVVYRPTARVRTRYRPILGGAVTRVRYGYAPTYNAPTYYAPTYYAPAPVVYAY